MLSEVHEQEEGLRTLQCVIEGKVKDPLLLVGTSGVGRRFSVLQAAKQSFGPSAVMIGAGGGLGTHPDLALLEPDEPGKDLKVKEVREVLAQAKMYPTLSRDRYIIIDGADQMSAGADNALLKTLEEPPPATRFFLLAERLADVLPPIRSRCGLVRYNRLSEAFIVSKLCERGSDADAALVCARLSDGSLGRAFRLWASSRIQVRDRMVTILRAAANRDLVTAFHTTDALQADSKKKSDDLPEGLAFLDHIIKDLFLVDYEPASLTNLDLMSDIRELRHKLGLEKLVKVRAHLRALGTLPKTALLSFHFKAALASALMG